MRTYDPVIYPLNLVVSGSIEQINAKYEIPGGGKVEKSETAIASTYKLNGKNGGGGAVVILINKRPDISTIAHEAFHAAHDIMTYIHEDFVYDGTNESWAYLIGWIALCIEDFVKKEFKEEKK